MLLVTHRCCRSASAADLPLLPICLCCRPASAADLHLLMLSLLALVEAGVLPAIQDNRILRQTYLFILIQTDL
jgi:hypothetical protein